MLRGMYVSASGMNTQIRKQEVISNNLANVDTPGFKKESLVVDSFSRIMVSRMNDCQDQGAAPVIGNISAGSNPLGTVTDFSEGKLVETGRPLDFALQGKGFFQVQTPQGLRYTRQGSFVVSGQGQLVTTEGYPVMGENGPIELGLDAYIGTGGEVVEEGTIVNRMTLVNCAPQDLVKEGESLYALNEGAQIFPGENLSLTQGFLESSNVNPVAEMVDMISGMRAYEANQKALISQDSTLGSLISKGLQF